MLDIAITGASGLVATELTFRLLAREDINLTLLSTHPEVLRHRYMGHNNIKCMTLDDFVTECHKTHYFAVIHAAFARNNDGKQLVESIEYTRKLLKIVCLNNTRIFINISSQSVYGTDNPPMWKENLPLSPAKGDMYALAKVFTEILTNTMLQGTNINYTSIRLSSVCENARFLRVFVDNAINGKPILVQGGNQRFSFIDVRDVASALLAVIDRAAAIKLSKAYNLGTGKQTSLMELANIVKQIGECRYDIPEVIIKQVHSDDNRSIGMDISNFSADFSWFPAMSEQDMIISLYEYIINVKSEKYPISFKYVVY